MLGSKLAQRLDPNAVLQALYRRFFDRIQIDEAWLRIVREAAERGPVVYVLRNLSFLDFMALDYITKRHNLPQVGFANDLGLWVLEPFARTWTEALSPQNRPAPAERLTEVIQQGGSAALFLKRPPTILEKATARSRRRVSTDGDTLVRTLFDLQQHIDRPIMLVPLVFVWSKRPESLQGSPLDVVFGPQEWPGQLRMAAQFLLNYRNVMLRAGEPIALRDFLRANAGESPDTLLRRGTYALLRKLDRERRAVLGPMRKPADRVRMEILRTPKLQQTIRQLAGEGPAERMLLNVRAYRMLRDLEASPDPQAIWALSTAIKSFVRVMYAGVEVDTEGLERVRQASQKGTVVLLPSHKSHIDYLLLSWVLYQHNLQLPLIAAGDNLSFFPMGMLLRRGGAFFIRRSFRGDRLYTSVVDAYLRRILRDGWPIEFFLEGTRSRTGKLLPPKLGLLSMLVDSGLSLRSRDVLFVPVSIGYERLVEEGSYVRELLGGEKEKENATALIRASRVLAERYGRLNIQFGEILSLADLVKESGVQAGKPLPPARRREVTTRVAYRTMARINTVTAATPGSIVALALLTHGRRGVSHAELVHRVRRLLAVLLQKGVRMTPALATPSGALRTACIGETTRMFKKAGLIEVHRPGESLAADSSEGPHFQAEEELIYTVPENKRLALDLSKNIILHFFVPEAMASAALLAAPGPGVAMSTLRERARRLSRLFKHEFVYSSEAPLEQVFDETLSQMVSRGELALAPDEQVGFGPGHDGLDGRGWVVLYASMIRNFLEAYWIAARGLPQLVKGPMLKRDLVRRCLTLGDKMYLAGEIERREALSRSCFENAFQSFHDQGFVRIEDQKRLALAGSFADAQAVRTIEPQISAFLTHRSEDRS